MVTTKVRELKSNLSKYLTMVEAGETIAVKKRNKIVGFIVPDNKNSIDDKVLTLVRKGLFSWSGGKPDGIVNRTEVKGKSLSDIVIEDRI